MAIGETTEERKVRLDKNETFAFEKLNAEKISFKQISKFGYFVNDAFDYWPRTGLFTHRKTKRKGRGINNLIRAVKVGIIK